MPTKEERMAKLVAAVAANEARKAALAAAATPEPVVTPEAPSNVVQMPSALFERFQGAGLEDVAADPWEAHKRAQAEVNRVSDSIGVVEVYRRMSKNKFKAGHETRTGEGIIVSCPFPWHEDKHPSAWLNGEKNLFHCGACGQGGDQWTIAAIYLRQHLGTYQKDRMPDGTPVFLQIKRYVAENLRGVKFVDLVNRFQEEIQEREAAKVKVLPVRADQS